MALGRSFVACWIAGEVLEEDIHDFIDRWHSYEHTDDSRKLHEFLGLSFEDYGLWVEQPNKLGEILLKYAKGR